MSRHLLYSCVTPLECGGVPIVDCEAYAEAFDNGYAIPSCAEIADDAIYAGLRFSRHDTIVNVLWNEFSGIVPQGSAAATMLPWSQRDTKSACRDRTYTKSIAARGGPRRVKI